MEKTFAAGDQHHRGIDVVDGGAAGLYVLHGERVVIERLVGLAGGILDGQATDAALHRAGDIGSNAVRVIGKAILEIGIQGQVLS
jgi:hypothetical protein